MIRPRFVLAVAAGLLIAACGRIGRIGESHFAVTQQESGTSAQLIGLDVVSAEVVWAAGAGGTFTWTDDGGATWQAGTVPGADSLQFRDVHAASLDVVYLLSIGSGSLSRIYRTADRGATWTLVFENDLEEAFYDCFDFWPDGAGLAFSDAVSGRFPMAATTDGLVWRRLPHAAQPQALEEEGGFAASGTCLVALGDSTALIGTGNAERARVLRTVDRGASWTAVDVPMAAGEGAGVVTLAFRDQHQGVALGGDLTRSVESTTAVTDNGGVSWRAAAAPSFSGAVYGSTYVPGTNALVAVGPGGAASSINHAESWAPVDTLSYWSVDAAGPSAVWAVGPEGRIARFALGL